MSVAATPVASGTDMLLMTRAIERTLKTLAFSWVLGALAGAFLAWLLVPGALSVEDPDADYCCGSVVGAIAGAALTRRSAVRRTS